MLLKGAFLGGSLLVLSLARKTHSLAVLLTLEGLVMLTLLALIAHRDLIFSVCFLSIGACEAAVGLSCMVGLVRLRGQEQLGFGECGQTLPVYARSEERRAMGRGEWPPKRVLRPPASKGGRGLLVP